MEQVLDQVLIVHVRVDSKRATKSQKLFSKTRLQLQ